jgi:hypothetical protein
MGSQVTSFTLVNMAKGINFKDDEADNFGMNIQPLKELPFTTVFIWN